MPAEKRVEHKPIAKKQSISEKPKAPKAGVAVKPDGKAPAPGKDASSTPVPSISSSALTVPTTGSGSKAKKMSPHPGGTTSSVGVAAKRRVSTLARGAGSRSRSTSVMPGASESIKGGDKKATNEEPEEDVVDDKLYCICKTKYDEDRVLIACDRDEWYYTQCVNMPDLEVDLVDQFICPVCIANNPNLPLKTTYKGRYYSGLQYSHPLSASACHKPARGAFSKYYSDDCAVKYMQSKIRRWGGDKAALWEEVKDTERREAVVVQCVLEGEEGSGEEPQNGAVVKKEDNDGVDTHLEVVEPAKSKAQREVDRLHVLLSRLPTRREVFKKEEEVAAELVGECGWDQRLCFGEDEFVEFGAEVMQSYDCFEDLGDVGAMQIDSTGEWWCRGKKKCERHAGWRKLRQAEAELEKYLLNVNLERLTAEERELRSRIEDVLTEPDNKSSSDRTPTHSMVGLGPLKSLNGDFVNETNGINGTKAKINAAGTDAGGRKGKKKKADGT